MAAANRLACSSSLQGVHAARCGAVLPPAMELTKAVTISSWAASANFQRAAKQYWGKGTLVVVPRNHQGPPKNHQGPPTGGGGDFLEMSK